MDSLAIAYLLDNSIIFMPAHSVTHPNYNYFCQTSTYIPVAAASMETKNMITAGKMI